jgi:hypothetical protein
MEFTHFTFYRMTTVAQPNYQFEKRQKDLAKKKKKEEKLQRKTAGKDSQPTENSSAEVIITETATESTPEADAAE